jgi:DNA-binding MarR family transcriptional regulator
MTDALRPFAVSVSQYTALSLLQAQPGLSNAQLARRTYVSPQAMNEIVKGLEQRHLVRRMQSPDHGQIKMTNLTDIGERLLEECDGAIDDLEQALFGGLGSVGIRRLRDALGDITRGSDGPDGSGGR